MTERSDSTSPDALVASTLSDPLCNPGGCRRELGRPALRCRKRCVDTHRSRGASTGVKVIGAVAAALGLLCLPLGLVIAGIAF